MFPGGAKPVGNSTESGMKPRTVQEYTDHKATLCPTGDFTRYLRHYIY